MLKLTFLQKHMVQLFQQGLSWQLFTWEGLFEKKSILFLRINPDSAKTATRASYFDKTTFKFLFLFLQHKPLHSFRKDRLDQNLSTGGGILKKTNNFSLRPNTDRSKNLSLFTDLGFKHNSLKLPDWLVALRVQFWNDSSLFEDFWMKNESISFFRLNADCAKATKRVMSIDTSEHSNSYFPITTALTSSIEVVIGTFNSVDGSSNWNSSNFKQATEFSWQPKSAPVTLSICKPMNFWSFRHEFFQQGLNRQLCL